MNEKVLLTYDECFVVFFNCKSLCMKVFPKIKKIKCKKWSGNNGSQATPGASCINVAYAKNGHNNVHTMVSTHISGFIPNLLCVYMCTPNGCS